MVVGCKSYVMLVWVCAAAQSKGLYNNRPNFVSLTVVSTLVKVLYNLVSHFEATKTEKKMVVVVICTVSVMGLQLY